MIILDEDINAETYYAPTPFVPIVMHFTTFCSLNSRDVPDNCFMTYVTNDVVRILYYSKDKQTID